MSTLQNDVAELISKPLSKEQQAAGIIALVDTYLQAVLPAQQAQLESLKETRILLEKIAAATSSIDNQEKILQVKQDLDTASAAQ